MKLMVQSNKLTMLLVMQLIFYGCVQLPVEDENSPYYTPPVSSVFVLNREVIIPPNEASVYLQYGKVIPSSDVEAWYPNCKFEVKDVLSVSQTIKPDTFEIARIKQIFEYVKLQTKTFASLSVRFSIDDGGGPTAEIDSTIFYLHSSTQPHVLYLTCQHWEDPADANYVTVAQIRQALGDVITLKIKGKDF